MLNFKQIDPGKAQPTSTALPRAGGCSPHRSARLNPVWQALALHRPAIQTKLTVGHAGDPHEREADEIAERVMRAPEPSPVRAARRQEIQRKPIASTITPILQPKRSASASLSGEASHHLESSRSGGSPLPQATRSFMESRFGADFSRVRIHTGSQAARFSQDLNARAFTVGSDIYFNAGNFSPESSEGKNLLAHELTHTVQQGALSSHKFGPQLMIQKKDGDKATTHFGEFEAEKYHALKRTSDNKEVGVEMFMKFKPNAAVDAKQIGLTQAAMGRIGGTAVTSVANTNYERRSATSGAGQGRFIDRIPEFPNPLYPTGDRPTAGADAAKLTSYPVVPSTALTAAQITAAETAGIKGRTRDGWGKHGFRYMDAGVPKGPESAELYDAPQLGVANESDQIFETTALAIEGTQKDTYYGSVTWGWKRDASGKFSMIPFKAISQGVPTVNFLTAASVWNAATEDFNWGVSAATADVLDPTDTTKKLASPAKGTALVFGGASTAISGVTYNLVQVKGTATVGLIKASEMSMMDVGRPTVDLPIDLVHKTNTAGVHMVTDPNNASATLVDKLPKDTRVTIVMGAFLAGLIAGAVGAKTTPGWASVRVVDGPLTGKTGWVKETLLTAETLGTH